jgi:cytochrome c oxidase assembly protein subunit 11
VATNNTNKTLTLSIVPSVSPGLAADNIKKIQCFCFSEQTLGPYETQEWPIRFYVDSELTENVNDVYLSYTLFEKEREEAVAVNHEH